MKGAELLRNEGSKRNPGHITIWYLCILCLVLADTQRHLKHGTCPRVLTIWLCGAELYTIQCSAYVLTNGLRATSEDSLQDEERAGPRLSNNLQGGCLLPGDWTETKCPCGDPGEAKPSSWKGEWFRDNRLLRAWNKSPEVGMWLPLSPFFYLNWEDLELPSNFWGKTNQLGP